MAEDADVRDQVRTVALAFLDAVASRDCDRILAMCADDVVFEWPMTKARISDFGDFRAIVGPVIAPLDGLVFHDVVVDEMLDPNEITLRYEGSATISTTGKPYRQTYVTQIQVNGGKVQRFREYFDRLALSEAMTPDKG
jgi:uncharacterized protein